MHGNRVLAVSVLLALIAGFAGIHGVVVAGHSDPNELHACTSHGKFIRFVTDPAECSANETDHSWSKQGPAGPRGPQGPAGPQGAPGPSLAVDNSRAQASIPANTVTTLLLLGVPEGSYVITAKLIVSPDAGWPANSLWGTYCNLFASSEGVIDKASFETLKNGDAQTVSKTTLALHGATTVSGELAADFELYCVSTVAATATNIEISAIQVGTLY